MNVLFSSGTDRTATFIVSTLPGWPDVSVLRAAARAGCTAVLNLEGVSPSAARTSLNALVASTANRLGVRLDSLQSLDWLATVRGLDVIVVPAPLLVDASTVERIRDICSNILVECVSMDDARIGEQIGAGGLIAKGHESGGRVGDETTFVLVQRLRAATSIPVIGHGGVGRHTIGALAVAGCAGVVLDAQLALARESTLPSAVKDVLQRFGGDETICLGSELGEGYRVYRRPGTEAVDELQRVERGLIADQGVDAAARAHWRDAVASRINWSGVGLPLWPLGQDAAFARPLASRFRSVPGIISGLLEALDDHVATAQRLRPLDRGAPLAIAHRTEYPILQGPMTRVSDTPGFADAVSRSGGLPFLALALLRGHQVRSLLAETKMLLGDRSWGVGILGFVPNELREEQLRAIEEIPPPFALIAGGRPDQAAKLEKHGIPTYLHVPAPSLLQMFLDDGARRFVFEGRECGGHVGPRTSFVLWESMVDTLLDAIDKGVPAIELHVVFAGGVHDAQSAAMVAAIGAPLAALGVRLGVLMGTAYLFTEEAVATGAIVSGFQGEAVQCSRTVLLETGPGHATRCAATPFMDQFQAARRALVQQGTDAEQLRLELEKLNLGRLRVASKGITRRSDSGGADRSELVSVGEDEQRAEGMYMIGQVAALRDGICRIADLHQAVSVGGSELLGRVDVPVRVAEPETASALSAEVAIVGVACLLPQALDPQALWRNILGKTDVIQEIPPDRFDIERYFDADRKARDKVYSKWGGFLGDVPFDPVKFGIPPAAVPSIDPFQLLTLEVASQALDDAGYRDRPFNRERTSVILGASGGMGELGFRYGIRSGLPSYVDAVDEETLARLPEWSEDSFAGVLLNVAAGRVANRLNLGGLNFTIDAACASSLAAVYVAARELEAGGSDMVIVGGFDTSNSPFGFQCFSSAQALSPTGRCRTFDQSADGIAISEGLVALVLKRLVDAERDGDRIYAVIRSVAGSSDGRGKGLMAPKPEGQMRVLQRAYDAAGFSPTTVGLVEAHGTGTVAGDAAEVTALSRVFSAAGTPAGSCALGSIKSMIGHTKSTAGVSGLLKVSLALYHKVVPPTLHVTQPNATLREADNPFFLPTEALPWIAPLDPAQPRRAAVSSFGFGGTNFHVVVEEYDANGPGALSDVSPVQTWPAELFVWSSPNPEHLLETLRRLDDKVAIAPDVPLSRLAAAVCRQATGAPGQTLRLAIVASSITDLRSKVAASCEALHAGKTALADASGVYLQESRGPAGKVAFVFPGQGSQYPGMHRDLAVHFPDVRQALEVADRVTAGRYDRRLSSFIVPPPAFTPQQTQAQQLQLTDTAVAQPALGAVEQGVSTLLARLGLQPDMTAGHSYGEYVALSVAGAFPPETLFALSEARGRAIKNAANGHPGTMAAVSASPEAVTAVLGKPDDVWIANVNSPRQTVLAGGVDAIDAAIARLSDAHLSARRIPVACAFHSPLVKAAGRLMIEVLDRTDIQVPSRPVFSNTLAAPYPSSVEAIRKTLAEHITSPVRFAEQLQAMYQDGARIFVEVGPRSVLSNLIRDTLGDRAPLVLSIDAPERHGVTQLLHVLAQLAVAGVAMDLHELWRGRDPQPLQLAKLAPSSPLPSHVWFVNGGRARRQGETPAAPRPLPTKAAAPSLQQPVSSAPVLVAPSAGRARSSVQRSPAQGDLMVSDTPTPAPQFVAEATSADVMQQFQQLMSQFLQTQAIVMTTYLQGAPASGLSAPTLARAPRMVPQRSSTPVASVGAAVAAPVTAGVPVSFPAHAPAAQSPAPMVPPQPMVPVAAAQKVAVAPAPQNGHGAKAAPPAAALDRLLEIVSDRTGYPSDMLSVDAHMEADLGIDSIKRMEILTAFQQMYAGERRGTFQSSMERLTAVKTLRDTAAVLEELLSAPLEAAVAQAAS